MSSTTNPYSQDIDFATLASRDVEFAKVLKSNGQLDFSDPKAVQQLTKSLLQRDFHLSLSLPDDRLCPPVPNRLNYVLWIQSLLDTTSDNFNDSYDALHEVIGVDIGTGASCIYPLLGCASRSKWKFIGTDIDEKSLQYARQNVEANNLQDRIKLIRTEETFFDRIPFDDVQIDFTMCNPPFYSSSEELISSAASKQRPPFTACTGSPNEMVTPGGEVAFISRMIDESLFIKDDCQWFTSMVGKLSSLTPLIEKLRLHEIDNYAVTEFVQGSKTRRWALGWSFGDLRPNVGICRGTTAVGKSLLPFPPEFVHDIALCTEDTTRRVGDVMSTLPIKWLWKDSIMTGMGMSDGNVWSRAARRKASRAVDQMEGGDLSFGVKIVVAAKGDGGGSKLVIRWVKGHDSVVFESFCGMLVKKLVNQ